MSPALSYHARRKAYLFLLNKLGLPRAATTRAVKGLALALDPLSYGRRRTAGRALAGAARPALKVPEASGYRLFAPEALPEAGPAVQACRQIFAEARASGALDARRVAARKSFLVPLTQTKSDLLGIAPIRDLVLSAPVLATAVDYFGTTPILASVQLLWSGANDTAEESQKYHLDTEDYRQLKLFLSIFDVTEDCGPFTFLPADRSAAICRQTGYVGGRHARLDDEAVGVQLGCETPVVATSRAGGGIFVDTSRCLHFGSRGNRQERLVLLAQFLSYYVPKSEPADWRKEPALAGLPLATPQRLLLRL